MIIMYNNLLKRILFPSLSIYFFPHFFTFFPSPNSNFGASWEKMGIFSILKIESLFPSLFIYFFPIFAHPQIQISVCLGEKWGWTPSPPPLHCIFNRNTVKLSYSCTTNIDNIVKAHNTKILSKDDTTDAGKILQL